MSIFRNGVRPALNIGLSVTRAGGIGHNKRQKKLASETLKLLADYRQAEEFSHFGSELAAEAKRALEIGKRLFLLMTQSPTDTYSLMSQQMMLDIVLHSDTAVPLDVNLLKLNVSEFAVKVTGDELYDQIRDELKAKCAPLSKASPAEEPKKADSTEKSDSETDKDSKSNEKPKDDKQVEARDTEKKEPAEVKT